MEEVFLNRRTSSDHGTFGEILVLKSRVVHSFKTGELPWRCNRPGESCIPCGSYVCRVTYSPKFEKKTYELFDVPGRTDIRIHSANYFGDKKVSGLLSEVDGCIGLGRVISTSGTQRTLLKSRDAVANFLSMLDEKEFLLTISAENISLR